MREITTEDLAQVCQILGLDRDRIRAFTVTRVNAVLAEITTIEPVRIYQPGDHDPF